jgi:hypothetical protein
MYLNSNNYEKKYKKYKKKYQILKYQIGENILIGGSKGTLIGGAKGTLIGGECVSLPNPEEEDFTTQNLLDLCPDERITIQNKCYNIKSLYEWIITRDNNSLPGTITMITVEEKQKLKREYRSLKNKYKKRKLQPFISYEQLPINVTIKDGRVILDEYKEEIREKYDEEGLGKFELPHCLTEDLYNKIIEQRQRIIKISGFGNRPDIDNMFLTVSEGITDKYDIDIWEIYSSHRVPLARDNQILIRSIFNLNIGNWNVVERGDYIEFASNINISLRRNLEPIELENLTFDKALEKGILIEIKSLVYRFDTDSDTFYFRLDYDKYGSIEYSGLTFYNRFSDIIKNRYTNPSGNTPRGARGYNAYWD